MIVSGHQTDLKGNCDFDNEVIVDVTPLWVASAAGHYDMVVKLISLGANVNATTNTNSTPLRAACYDGHVEVAKENVHNTENQRNNFHVKD